MKLKNVVWSAVVSALAGITGIAVAVAGASLETVTALAGVSIASAILAQREK